MGSRFLYPFALGCVKYKLLREALKTRSNGLYFVIVCWIWRPQKLLN